MDQIVKLTSETEWLIGKGFLGDDEKCPTRAVITLKEVRKSDRVFIRGKCSKHETWVANRRLLHDAVELKHGMTLTFGKRGIFPTA